MKNLPYSFLLLLIALTAGSVKLSAADYSNIPENPVMLSEQTSEAPASATESDSSNDGAEMWKVITKENNHQVITLHLHQKLALKIHQLIQSGEDRDYALSVTEPALLKSTLFGKFSNLSSGYNDSYLWLFQPLEIGQTHLTVKKLV